MIKVLMRTLVLEQCIDVFYGNLLTNFIKPKLQQYRRMSPDEVSSALNQIFPELFPDAELFQDGMIKLDTQTGKTNLGIYYAMRYIYDKDDDKTFDL